MGGSDSDADDGWGRGGWMDWQICGYMDGLIYFGNTVFVGTCVHGTSGYIFQTYITGEGCHFSCLNRSLSFESVAIICSRQYRSEG